MENIIKFLPRGAVAFLRIAASDARFPIRPVSEGSFLIGHGTDCDLRLGDHEVPALHSILNVTRSSASITLIAEKPELLVNGEAVSRAAGLIDGDIVEIGDVRLVFCFVAENTVPAATETLQSRVTEVIAQPDLTAMRALGITGQSIRKLREAGYTGLTPSRIIELRAVRIKEFATGASLPPHNWPPNLPRRNRSAASPEPPQTPEPPEPDDGE